MNHLLPLSCEYLMTRILCAPDVEAAMTIRLLAYLCLNQRLLPMNLPRCCAIAQARGRAGTESCELVLHQHFDITELGRRPVEGLLILPGPLKFAMAEDVDIRHASVTYPSRTRNQDELVTQGVTLGASPASRMQRYRSRQQDLMNEARRMGLSLSSRTSVGQLQQAIDEAKTRNASVTHPSPAVTQASRVRADLQEIPKTENQLAALAARERGVTQGGVTHPVTAAGSAAMAMKAAGLQAVNPGHPELIKLLQAGATTEELAGVAAEAASQGKGFAYALAMCKGRRADAARSAAAAQDSKAETFAAWAGPEVAARLLGGAR